MRCSGLGINGYVRALAVCSATNDCIVILKELSFCVTILSNCKRGIVHFFKGALDMSFNDQPLDVSDIRYNLPGVQPPKF